MPPLTSPPPTILIVEDEPSIASALTRLLTRDGYQAEVARDGQEALTACQRQAYTQILCDLWMPVLDGQGFYEALRRCQPHRVAKPATSASPRQRGPSVAVRAKPTVTPTVQPAPPPSGIRPWTPQRDGLQRYTVTHAGQRRNGPPSREFPASGPSSQVVAGVGFKPT